MRTFIAIGGLLVLALLAALVAPFFIDWTAYRSSFEREAGRLLGQPVVVRGTASARLLPFPSLTFTDVAVGATESGEPLMTLAGFGLDAELAPYLSGEIRIFQMRLDAPHLRLSIRPDGLVGWNAQGTLPGGGASVVLEDIRITDGRITLDNPQAGKTYELSGIDAEFAAASLAGPYSGGGTLEADGRALRFTASSGVVQEIGTVPVRVGIQSDAANAAFSIDGTARLAEGQPEFTGSFQVDSPLPPGPPGAKRPTSDPAEASPLPPIHVASLVTVSPVAADLSAMRVEVGDPGAPYVLNGSGRFDYGASERFALTLSGEQVNVDAIASQSLEEGAPVAFADRVEAVRRTLAAIPMIDVPAEIRLTLPVVTAGDTTIRNVSLTGSPSEEGWQLDGLSAELPGRTLLEATGTVSAGDTLGFRGDLLLASRQPPSFAGWLTGAVDPALNAVDRVGFSATVDFGSRRQILDNLEVDVGGQTLVGRLERSGPDGDRTVAVQLGGEAADLDAFGAFLRLFVSDTDAFEAPDRLSVQFDAGPVTFSGVGASRIEADLSYDSGLLDLRSFVAEDFAGADVRIGGAITDLAGDPKPDVSVAVSAEDPQRFFDFLRARFPDSPTLRSLGRSGERLGPLSLSGTALSEVEGGIPALKVRLDGSAGGTKVDFALALENGLAAARRSGRFGLEIGLTSDKPAELLAQFGLGGVDLATPSPLDVKVSLSGSEIGPVVTTAAIRAPGSTVYANGLMDLSTEGIESLDLSVKAASDDAAPWLLATGAGLAPGPGSRPVDLAASLSWFKGDWSLSDVAGTVAGSSLEAQFQGTRSGPVTGSVTVSELSIPWLSTLVYGLPPTPPLGGEGWTEGSFGAPLLPDKPFSIDLEAARLDLGPTGAVAGFAAHLDGDAQSLRLSDASGRLATGTFNGSAEARNIAGFGSVSLAGSFTGVTLPTSAEAARTAPISGTLGGRLTLESGAQSYPALVASLSGSGAVTLAEGRLAGIPTDLLPPVLLAADAEGFQATSQATAALVGRLGEAAVYPLGDVGADFEAGSGILRFKPLAVGHAAERLTGEGTINLPNRSADFALTLRLDPGEERVDGAEPVLSYRLGGPIGDLRLVADVEKLTGYLSLRAIQREEARVARLREDLRETLRLRREARYYRSRQAERERFEAGRVAAEAERLRLERQQADTEQAQAAEAAREAERRRLQEAAARRAAEDVPVRPQSGTRPQPSPRPLPDASSPTASSGSPQPRPSPDFDAPVGVGRAEPPPAYEGLPGVSNPMEF